MLWNFERHGGNTAVIDEEGKACSYAFLADAGARLAERVGGRKLVFCLCSNSIGSLVGYSAFLNARIVPVLLDANLNGGLLDALIERYKPDFIWKPSDATDIGYSLVKTEHDNAFPLHDELALLLTTSGSTGSPKLVRQSYANIRANTASIVECLALDETERPISTLPMNYTYGLSIINSHLWVGASLILTNKTLMQKEFWQQFKEYGATSFGGVPYSYEMLDKLRFSRMDLPTLRTMTQAGGRLSLELHKKFAEYAQERGKKFIVMYGQAEATARMSYLPAEKSLEKCGSVGVAIPGGAFSLMDADGKEITKPEVVGELIYKGANVTMGYAESGSDLMKGDERGGVLATDDMAKRDADGYYTIVGRKKRFLKLFGNRVSLDETEELLSAAFSEMDCACCGMDDKMSVFITDGSKSDDALKFLSEKTGINRMAFRIVILEKIPRNEAGKILYSNLECVSV